MQTKMIIDTTYEDTQAVSDHSGKARRIHGIATREGIFKAGGGSPHLVNKRIFRPGDLLQRVAGTLIGKNVYLGSGHHPLVEDDGKSSGKVVESWYDPGTKAVKYTAEVDNSRLTPDVISMLESGKVIPNSVRGFVHVDWTPGVHPQYGRYDGREVFLDLQHVAQVAAGACPAGSCGIGLHCSCEGKIGGFMAPFKGVIDSGAIAGVLDHAQSMEPTKALEAALSMLQAISDHMAHGTGPFQAKEISYPFVDEKGELGWGTTADHAEAKAKGEATMAALAQAITEEKKLHGEAKKRLAEFEKRDKEADEKARAELTERISKGNPLFAGEEQLKILSALPTEQLKVLSAALPDETQHEESRRPRFSDPGTSRKTGGDKDILKGIKHDTPLTKEQHMALRKQYKEISGRDLIPVRMGIKFGNPDVRMEKPGAK